MSLEVDGESEECKLWGEPQKGHRCLYSRQYIVFWKELVDSMTEGEE